MEGVATDEATSDARPSPTRRCNAVFKGGGAKGIAYAGALEACERWDVEFVEVAGSSAGAITAALVACGYTAEQVIDLMPEALQAIDSVPRSVAKVGLRASLLSGRSLHSWLQVSIADAIVPGWRSATDSRGPGDGPPDCTFEDIRQRTGVSLYVVTLDLATRQPLVFCPALTPRSPVAAAVVASSAIPVAFPASRMDVDGEIHRLVDGGTWSNYPSFVFLDRDFREHHGLEPNDRPTIGFILDPDAPEPTRVDDSPRPRRGAALISDRGSSASQLGFAGAVVSSTVFRWALGVMPLLFVVLSFAWLREQLTSEDAVIASVPQQFQDLFIVSAVAVLAVTGVLATGAALLILRLGRSLFDTGVVGASAAMGVGPGVPYWVGTRHAPGTADQHVAVRIKVPTELTTLNFAAGPDVQRAARQRGHDATVAVLTSVFGPPTGSAGSAPTTAQIAGGWREAVGVEQRLLTRGGDAVGTLVERLVVVPLAWAIRLVRQKWYVRFSVVLGAVLLGATAAFGVINGLAGRRGWGTLIPIALVGVAVAVILFLLADMRTHEATRDDPYPWLSRLRRPWIVNTLAALAVAFAVILAIAPSVDGDRSYYTALRAQAMDARVLDVEQIDGIYTAFVAVPAAQTIDNAADTFEDLVGLVGSGADTTATDFTDLANALVLVDTGTDGPTEDLQTLFVFLQTFTPVEAGDPVVLRVDLGERLVFLDTDVETDSTAQGELKATLVLVLALVVFAFRTRRAARWMSKLSSRAR